MYRLTGQIKKVYQDQTCFIIYWHVTLVVNASSNHKLTRSGNFVSLIFLSSCSLQALKSVSLQPALYSVRYFVMKSSNIRNIEISQDKGIWSTTPINENKLSKAYLESNLIILIFSVQGSGHFQVTMNWFNSVSNNPSWTFPVCFLF